MDKDKKKKFIILLVVLAIMVIAEVAAAFLVNDYAEKKQAADGSGTAQAAVYPEAERNLNFSI
ncbi:MAG: hypothetical protein ACI4VM_06600 [Anaerovoracaceae bacterium]